MGPWPHWYYFHWKHFQIAGKVNRKYFVYRKQLSVTSSSISTFWQNFRHSCGWIKEDSTRNENHDLKEQTTQEPKNSIKIGQIKLGKRIRCFRNCKYLRYLLDILSKYAYMNNGLIEHFRDFDGWLWWWRCTELSAKKDHKILKPI